MTDSLSVLIVEDELRAASRLRRLILELVPNTRILAELDSVAETLAWLCANDTADLIFMDVQLSDGDSFEIIAKHDVESPIVFCTAYSEYALRAFDANSIDYLLKPVTRAALKRALDKYRRLAGIRMHRTAWPDFPRDTTGAGSRFRQQFLVALAGRIHPVRTIDIVAAQSYLKGTRLADTAGRRWVLDDSLTAVEESLDPADFVRVSRQWLVRVTAITELRRKNAGYELSVEHLGDPVRISRARVRLVKRRLDR